MIWTLSHFLCFSFYQFNQTSVHFSLIKQGVQRWARYERRKQSNTDCIDLLTGPIRLFHLLSSAYSESTFSSSRMTATRRRRDPEKEGEKLISFHAEPNALNGQYVMTESWCGSVRNKQQPIQIFWLLPIFRTFPRRWRVRACSSSH